MCAHDAAPPSRQLAHGPGVTISAASAEEQTCGWLIDTVVSKVGRVESGAAAFVE
jgi:hypothetical protein